MRCIQSLVFLILICICSLDLTNKELQSRDLSIKLPSYHPSGLPSGPPSGLRSEFPSEPPQTRGFLIPPMLVTCGISIGILLAGYIVLSAWVNYDLKVRQLGSHSYTGRIWRMSTRLLPGLASVVHEPSGLEPGSSRAGSSPSSPGGPRAERTRV